MPVLTALESLRPHLYFLGFLANLLFGGRFLLQWLQSEKRGESIVSPSFWKISCCAHICMCLHGYIQLQYPICILQGLNATIAWRNLNLMGREVKHLSTVCILMGVVIVFLSFIFFIQTDAQWMQAPMLPWNGQQAQQASLVWHVLGSFGMFLFATRYWIQWWLTEKHSKSFLGKSFWWLSSIGAFFSLLYALRLKDPVNIFGFSLGLVPYLRNLVLLNRAKNRQQAR